MVLFLIHTHTRIHTRSVKVTRMYAGPVSRVSSYKHWLLNSHGMSSQVQSTPLLASGAHSIGFRMNLSVVSVTETIGCETEPEQCPMINRLDTSQDLCCVKEPICYIILYGDLLPVALMTKPTGCLIKR